MLRGTILLFALTAQCADLRILKAVYGADRKWLDVTAKVQALAQNDQLEFKVEADTLTDPLPGVPKVLRIRYLYRNQVKTAHYKDLEQVKLPQLGNK